jgi:hypothetical protein
MTAGGTESFSAKTNDDSTVTWSIEATTPSPTIEFRAANQSNGPNFNFQIHAGDNAKGTHQFVITAKDSSRNINTSKTITVIIQ